MLLVQCVTSMNLELNGVYKVYGKINYILGVRTYQKLEFIRKYINKMLGKIIIMEI